MYCFTIIVGILILFPITAAGSIDNSVEEHEDEKPHEKYTAEFNEQEPDDEMPEAEKEQDLLYRAEEMILIGKDQQSIGNKKTASKYFDGAYKYAESFAHSAPPGSVPTTESRITELFIHPEGFEVISGAGKTYEGDYESLAELLSTYRSRITRIQFVKVTFDHKFVNILNSAGRNLFSGNIRFGHCDFTPLTENDIMDLFRNTLVPESFTFVQDKGISSRVLNKAISEGILDCELAILGDAQDNIRLNPEHLLNFLHRPVNKTRVGAGRAYLSLPPEYIEGGVNAFVEQLVKRFQTDTSPAPFRLQLAKDIELPEIEKSLQNKRTMEILKKGKVEIHTVLDRVPYKK
ncbi:hypothetical protein Ddc_14695 [Ditylenchus destructor]|nr:hypothetical protein Ddc_14695 [Ditylenchus destructor]